MIMDDLLLYIFGCGVLGPKDLQTISLVCRRWHAVASEPYLQRQLLRGYIFSFGQNKRGCLGQGNTLLTEQLRPRTVKGIHGLDVVSVAAGDLHTLLLTRSGKVYSFGCGLFGKLGHGFGQCEFFPRQVSTLQGHNIVKVAAGPQHSVALNEQGRVFTFGCGRHGRLGHGDEVCEFLPRRLSLEGVRVVDVVAGGKQTFLISHEGHVYSFGYGWYGALGHGAQLSVNRPKLIEGLLGHHIVAVAAGGYHTLAMTREGQVFAFGSGFYGQLGIPDISDEHCRWTRFPSPHRWLCPSPPPRRVGGGSAPPCRAKREKYSLSPVLVPAFSAALASSSSALRATAIGAGDHHSVVLANDGKVYTFGAGGSGRLGLGTSEENHFEPTMVQSLRAVTTVQLSVGRSHALLVSKEGQVFSFGSGCYGKLGHGDQTLREFATPITHLAKARAQAVFAGGNSSFILT